jgi:hypothetical protein
MLPTVCRARDVSRRSASRSHRLERKAGIDQRLTVADLRIPRYAASAVGSVPAISRPPDSSLQRHPFRKMSYDRLLLRRARNSARTARAGGVSASRAAWGWLGGIANTLSVRSTPPSASITVFASSERRGLVERDGLLSDALARAFIRLAGRSPSRRKPVLRLSMPRLAASA